MTDEEQPDRVTWIRSVLERHEGPLTRYAARITGDVELAREVVQETFLRLCDQPHLELQDHTAEWLFTVCRNRALDVRKKEQRMKRLSEARAATWESPDPPPPRAAESREVGDRVG